MNTDTVSVFFVLNKIHSAAQKILTQAEIMCYSPDN